MLASTIFRFFFSLSIDILPAVENKPATDCPLPAAVSCPPLPGHLMLDEEESQLSDAYSKSSFRKGNLIGLTVILVIECRVRAFISAQCFKGSQDCCREPRQQLCFGR